MAQDELPCAVLLAKDVRHSERHRCGLLLAGNLHVRALDRRRKGQVSTLDAGEIVDRQPGGAVTEARAARLLSAPEAADRSITDIAFACGFNDSSHFGRVFAE